MRILICEFGKQVNILGKTFHESLGFILQTKSTRLFAI